MILVKPATVAQWHRQGFLLHWRWRSRRPGRPKIRTAGPTRCGGRPRITGNCSSLASRSAKPRSEDGFRGGPGSPRRGCDCGSGGQLSWLGLLPRARGPERCSHRISCFNSRLNQARGPGPKPPSAATEYFNSKYPPAEPGALGCEPLEAAVGSLTRPRLRADFCCLPGRAGGTPIVVSETTYIRLIYGLVRSEGIADQRLGRQGH